jgi:chromosome partitioning protein
VGRLIAVANQKGGVAKTTTVHSLGFALAELGRRVLLVDLDPQACLTYSAGIDADSLQLSLHDVFQRKTKVTDIRRRVGGIEGLEILPAAIDLGASEIELLYRNRREFFLSYFLSTLQDDYDFILIDCPPSLGVLTINGLTAAAEVVIPFQCEALSTRGVGQLLETIEDVRMFTNTKLRIRGVIATMYDGHTRHARDMLTRIREHYGLAIFDPPVRKSIRFAEAPQIGRCILQHDPSSPGAEAYRSIARDLDAFATSIEPEPPFALAPVFSYEDLLATRYAFVS